MPWHKDEVTDVITPSKDFQYLGGFRNAVVVVNNLVARATTRWTLEEAKLFMLAVSQIEMRDEDCWVRLRKKDIISSLGLDPRKSTDLRRKLVNVKDKSQIELEGPTADDWEAGNLIRRVKTDRYYALVQFDDYYLPLLHYVKDQLFTKFEVQSIVGLKHKSSYNLYLYLTSWHNANYLVNKRNVGKNDLAKVFNLLPGQYWRNWGTDKAKFHWSDFERFCLNPAVEDINSNPNCDMHIDKAMKVKDPSNMKTVLGYTFEWHYCHPDGSQKIRSERPALLPDPDKYLTIEEQNYIQMFMKHFQKLSDRQLKDLSDALGSTPWADQPAWSVGELKQERTGNCISPQLYNSLRAKMGWVTEGYSIFAPLFGYGDTQTFMVDIDAVGTKMQLMK